MFQHFAQELSHSVRIFLRLKSSRCLWGLLAAFALHMFWHLPCSLFPGLLLVWQMKVRPYAQVTAVTNVCIYISTCSPFSFLPFIFLEQSWKHTRPWSHHYCQIIECSVRCCVCEVSLEWETHNWTGSRQHINYTQTLRVDKKKCQGFAGGSLSAELSWLCKGRVNFSVKICTFICCGWKSRTERGYSCYKDMQLTQKSCTLNNSNRRFSENFFPRKNRSFL